MHESNIVIPVTALRRTFIGLVLIILLLVALIVARQSLWRVGLGDLIAPGIGRQIERSGYQAVFLTGGQVFFGKLEVAGEDYFTLSDVFYLSTGDGGQPNQLIKRGNELHGPTEPMIIPARDVLFIENLRANSDVVSAITKFKAGQLPIATPPPATVAPGTTRPSPTR